MSWSWQHYSLVNIFDMSSLWIMSISQNLNPKQRKAFTREFLLQTYIAMLSEQYFPKLEPKTKQSFYKRIVTANLYSIANWTWSFYTNAMFTKVYRSYIRCNFSPSASKSCFLFSLRTNGCLGSDCYCV